MFKEVICVDLHNDAIVGFFQIPVTHISAQPVLIEELKKLNVSSGVVVSPDVGGVKRARNFAYALDMPMVVMEKRRFLDKHDTSEHYQVIGDVKGKTAIIIDDVISTGGTTAQGASSLKENGADRIIVLASHGVLAADAKEKLSHSPIDHVIVTNTIAVPKEKMFDKLTVVSVAQLLADAISSIVR